MFDNLGLKVFKRKLRLFCTISTGANDILDVLDLSWNCLRQKGAISVAKGIKVIQVKFQCISDIRRLILWFIYSALLLPLYRKTYG